ncbi:MAG: hypothetical protein AAGC81_17985 [Pseudomonadota bacterium]
MRLSLCKYFVFSAAFVGAGGFFVPGLDDAGHVSVMPPSAQAQLRLQDCRDSLVQGSTSGETILRCKDGRYFRRVGGRYQEVDEQGNPLQRAEPEPTPSEPAEAEVTLTPANPDFKKVPTGGGGGSLDTSRSGFKKVPGS